jgi:maltose O-acetyltransferase
MIYSAILKLLSGLRTAFRRELYYQHVLKGLQKRGLSIGKDVYVAPGVEFDHGYPFLIEVQDHCRISTGTMILAHDATTFRELGVTRLGKVRILEGSFIGSHVIILPGCTIGPNAMIAAGSVVNRDIGEGFLAAGNPARPYGKYSELLEKYQEMLATNPVFEYDAFLKGAVSPEALKEALDRTSMAFMRGPLKPQTLLDRILWWRREYEWVG